MPRSLEEIVKLFDYNRWANARTLDAASGLTPEELGRTLGGSFPSVRDTLKHIYEAEWIWLERWKGTSPASVPPSQQVSDFETLRQKWDEVEENRRAYLRGLSDARLSEVLSYRNLKGDSKRNALGELFVHVVNHSSYHRGQVVTMIRQLGKKPLGTDYVAFLDTLSAPS